MPFYAPPPPERPRLRLLCLPFAGGGVGIYRSWPGAMPEGVQVVPVELPGRERRLKEPAYKNMGVLLRDLGPALEPLADVPFAVFGHSMGAAIAYEVARAATSVGKPPVALFLSARRAPQEPPPHPPFFALPKDTLIAEMERLYGKLPPMLKSHPHLLDMFLPTMRADFQLLDTWKAPVDQVLTCPIHAYAAADDHAVPPPTLDRWAELTSGPYRKTIVPGGHFGIRETHDIRDDVAQVLSALL